MTDEDLTKRLSEMEERIKNRVESQGFSWVSWWMLAYLVFESCTAK